MFKKECNSMPEMLPTEDHPLEGYCPLRNFLGIHDVGHSWGNDLHSTTHLVRQNEMITHPPVKTQMSVKICKTITFS